MGLGRVPRRAEGAVPTPLLAGLSGVLVVAAALIVLGTSVLLFRMDEGSAAAGGRLYLGLLGLVAYGWVVGLLLRVRRRGSAGHRRREVLVIALVSVAVIGMLAGASALGARAGAPHVTDPR